MALERATPRAVAESLTQIDSSLPQQKLSPKSFHRSGNIKPLKKITKLTPEQLEKGFANFSFFGLIWPGLGWFGLGWVGLGWFGLV